GRIETLGDGACDEGCAFLLQQLDQPLLLRHERIDPLSLPVEEGGDGALLRVGWEQNGNRSKFLRIQVRLGCPRALKLDLSLKHIPAEQRPCEEPRLTSSHPYNHVVASNRAIVVLRDDGRVARVRSASNDNDVTSPKGW